MNALIYLLLTILLGSAVEGKVESSLRGHLRDSFGTVEEVQLHIDRGHNFFSKNIQQIDLELAGFQAKNTPSEGIKFSPGKDVTASTIKKINLTTRRFEYEGLPVEEMQVSLEGLRFNLWRAVLRRKLEVLEIKKAHGSILLKEQGLNRFLAPRLEMLQEPKIKLRDGRVEVSGKVKGGLGVSCPILFSCGLQPELGRINLTEPKLKVSVLPVPSFLTQRIIESLNPIVDLNQSADQPCFFRIKGVQIDDTGLSAQADLIFKRVASASPANTSAGTAQNPHRAMVK